MRLRQLKLAGFKSFVDSIVIPFPSQLVGVVGPNGCGKSNIIDAVRWVMGESHAKNLRGESMVDVIFKGATTRKSVGQAFVELTFDNQLGRLTGPYASYQEIAVKRLVTRDGESTFFLNGTRCRRRDVTDIFLGTGAGPRSYSIIGQDTISRLIESRPEDLRGYLEEAAGISKYKDRRRETLQRIALTRENLSRVADIQAELTKQLARLERQAHAAIRYKELKQQERQCRVEILSLKWQHLMNACQAAQQQYAQCQLQQDTHQTDTAQLYARVAVIQEELNLAQIDYQKNQTHYYQLATEIARLDEALRQEARDRKQLQIDQQQIIRELEQVAQQINADQTQIQMKEENLRVLELSHQACHARLVDDKVVMETHQQVATESDQASQALIFALHEAERNMKFENMHLQKLDVRRQQLQLHFEKNQVEQSSLDHDMLGEDFQPYQAEKVELEAQYLHVNVQYQQMLLQGSELQQRLQLQEQQLHRVQDKTRAIAIELAALKATQQAAFKSGSGFLSQNTYQGRLAESVKVDEAWLPIVECILGDYLQAIVVDSIDALTSLLPTLEGNSGIYTETKPCQLDADNTTKPYPRLLDYVSGDVPSSMINLEQIFAAETLQDACSWLPFISTRQSIATQNGFWIGQDWIRVFNLKPQADDEVGLLSRQRALEQLSVDLQREQDNITQLTKQRNEIYVLLTANERDQLTLKEQIAALSNAIHQQGLLIEQKKQAYDYTIYRLDRLTAEQATLQTETEQLAAQHLEVEAKKMEALHQYNSFLAKKQQLLDNQASAASHLLEAKRIVETTKATLHAIQLECAQEKTTISHLKEQIKRSQQQQTQMQERLENLIHRGIELGLVDGLASEARCRNPSGQRTSIEPKQSLDNLLLIRTEEHRHAEHQFMLKQQQVNDLQQRLQETEQICKYEEQQIKNLQTQLQAHQLEEQTMLTRATSVVEQLDELDKNWRDKLFHPDDTSPTPVATMDKLEQDLVALEAKINRLGAINLLAIDEYQSDLGRKEHLDAQHEDLNAALATLERAIAKMDQETKQRLQETFDAVNSAFQRLFPRLFGGGQATLTLTSDDLLTAGVLVMAQPPGKRNNTIYMLSGGEKAMTAVALLFAIFQLNPSPFCMLDEVDAPLDDANIRRFCDLVRDMSQFVQFLFVTHNKVTMELADHLIGVTMREPGVSRIVSVDIAEQHQKISGTT